MNSIEQNFGRPSGITACGGQDQETIGVREPPTHNHQTANKQQRAKQ